MATGYKPPPSVKTQLPDATIGDLPRIAAPATATAPAAAAAPVAAPPGLTVSDERLGLLGIKPVPIPTSEAARQTSLTKQQKMIQMMKDAKAAMAARDAAMDAELEKALAQPMTTPGPEPTLTVKRPGGSGAPK